MVFFIKTRVNSHQVPVNRERKHAQTIMEFSNGNMNCVAFQGTDFQNLADVLIIEDKRALSPQCSVKEEA